MLASSVALKEWTAVVDAFATGDQMLLLRKGGIRDPQGAFQLQHREFFLYPTWEHQSQDESLIRPEFRHRFKERIAQPRDPTVVSLSVYAGVAFCAEVTDPDRLEGLQKYHIWAEHFITQRMKYRPQAPTLAVLVRAYRLNSPVALPVKPEYAGCKSWVPLYPPIPLERMEPVVENRRFREILEEVSTCLT